MMSHKSNNFKTKNALLEQNYKYYTILYNLMIILEGLRAPHKP